MEFWYDALQNGVTALVCLFATGVLCYKLIFADRDDARNREQKLHDLLQENAAILSKAAATIEASDKTLCELSETNKLLVEKIEGRLDHIDETLGNLADKVDDL
jgi:hypothetical protein